MSASADTIKDFLVSLGFDIDNAGANKFEAVVKGVTANVLKLGATVEGAAASVLLFTTKIADGLDKLYWASQRTGATVAGIKALGYAASQTGGNAQAALSSLEGLASFMRNNPGGEGFLNRLGVQTRDASGKMRDTAAIFTGVGQKLNSMPYYRARQYAQMLGIDENTLQSMRRGLAGFTSDYQSMMQKTGFNADKAAQQSNKFMTSMRGLTGLLGILRDKIGSNLAGGLAGSLDSLRKRILDNFPKIEETLTRLIKGILWFADAFARMGYRLIQGAGAVIDWWKRLDDGSKNLLKVFGALLVAWRLLNSSFLMSPIGLITTLIGALILLWDDYKTWKEGGKSLIDWSKWQPEIEQAKKAFVWLRDKLLALKDQLGGWKNTLAILLGFLVGAKLVAALGGIAKITGGFLGLGKAITGSIGGLANLAKGIAELAIKNPWLLLFVPANNTPNTTEELKRIGGVGSNVVPDRKAAYDALRKENPGKDFFSDDEIQRKLQSMGKGGEPEQRAQSAKNPQLDALNKTQSDYRQESSKGRAESKTALNAANTLLSRIITGIQRVGDLIAPPETDAGNIGEQAAYLQRGNNTMPIKAPQPTKAGSALLGWMGPLFSKLEAMYQLPAGLLKSVAITESSGNQFAEGPQTKYGSAKGLFQFVDSTAKSLGLKGNDVFDPEKSAQAAAKYLSQLLRQNGGNLDKALASYNWGIGNVQRYGMGLMPAETRNYIPKVRSNMPGGGPQIQQQNTYNIYGGNAHEIGGEVEHRQLNANAKAMRTNQVRTG
ncbi:lytic transglycosylase domain-containing protein [Cedecea neteri]|uniref:lytic transglycosylase domain-containing protein n=1 Tax=Cedecea neteri TaxID=158822 RepID=UPI0028A2B9DC|nr:lytic transglycosylase domain-containing protein [Cedecea neteri]